MMENEKDQSENNEYAYEGNVPSEAKTEIALKVDLTDEINAIAKEIQRDKAKGVIKNLLEARDFLASQIVQKQKEVGVVEEALATVNQHLKDLASGDLSVLSMVTEKQCVKNPTTHPWYNEFYFRECPLCKAAR